MPPKKKASEVAGPSASNPSPLEQAGGGGGAGGGTGVAEPVLGHAAYELAPRPSQEARNQRRTGTHGAIRSLDPDRAGGSQGAQGQQANQRAGTSVARLPGPDTAPSNVVRSSSTSRSTRHSPPLPTTPAEALARAQLLLDYPPTGTGSTAGGPPFRASSVSPTATRRGSPMGRSRGRPSRREPMGPRLAGVRPPCTLRTSGSGRRLAGPSTTTTPLRRQTRELVATNAKSFTSERKKTLEPASSAKEKRGVNQTSALSHLATCMHRGSQATCRIR